MSTQKLYTIEEVEKIIKETEEKTRQRIIKVIEIIPKPTRLDEIKPFIEAIYNLISKDNEN
jgi:hypothetical protein